MLIEDNQNKALEEIKRADHLVHVTLKYTRTADVIKNIIERLINSFDFTFLEYLLYLKDKGKLRQIPDSSKARLELFKKEFKGKAKIYLNLYTLMKSIFNAEFGKKEEFRKHVTLISTSYIGKTNFNNLKKSLYGFDGLTDYVLIDAPSGNNYETIHLINSVDEIIIVVNPETSCLTDALKTIRIANYYEKPIKGIIINKASQNDFFTEADIKLLLKNDILGIIHNDDNLKLSNHYKDSIVNLYPFSQSSLDFKKLASNLVNEYYEVESHKKSFFSKIFRK